jgi:hypothetical protein
VSEVKPTLSKDVLRDPVSPNTWQVNFRYWLWDSSRYREYTWIVAYFTVIFAKGYEYKISFESPVENFGITFPFVVKTQSPNVKSVFIYGLDYPTRSKSNYGTSFVVSGSHFHFKSATKYKLDGEVFNIVRIFYFSPKAKNINKFVATIPTYLKQLHIYNQNSFTLLVIPNYIISVNQKDISNIDTDLFAEITEPIFSAFFREISHNWFDLISTRNISPVLFSKSLFDVYPHNTKNLTLYAFKTREFADVGLNTVRTINPHFTDKTNLTSTLTLTISGEFKNINEFNVSGTTAVANCINTTWNRFGGEWTSCGTWKLLS